MPAKATWFCTRDGFAAPAANSWTRCEGGRDRGTSGFAGRQHDEYGRHRAVLQGAWVGADRIHYHRGRDLAHRAPKHALLAHHSGSRRSVPGDLLPGATAFGFVAAVIFRGLYALRLVALVARSA